MWSISVAFFAGCLLLIQAPVQIDARWLALGLPVALAGLMFSGTRIAAMFLLGMVPAALALLKEAELRLPAEIQQQTFELTGQVMGLPKTTDGFTRFIFLVESGGGLQNPDHNASADKGVDKGHRVRLVWRHAPGDLAPGDRYQLTVRLRPPSGSVNFDLFDYERWLFAQRIHGTGYVLQQTSPHKLATRPVFLRTAAIRYRLGEALQAHVHPSLLPTFLALTFGDTRSLSSDDWETLNRTGTTHLLIVSGLHIGLVATLVFAAGRLLGGRLWVTVLLAWGATGCFALLAGWGLPVQRAFLMASVFLVSLLLARNVSLPARYGFALVVVLLVDPLALLSTGFWLSFGVVGALIAALSNRHSALQGLPGWLDGALSAQWVAFLSLMPALAYVTQGVPVGSLLINLLAIPWVGVLLLPSMLAGVLLLNIVEPVGLALIRVAEILTGSLWWWLDRAGELPIRASVAGFGLPVLLMATLGVMMLLAPRGLLPRWPGLLLLSLIALPPNRPLKGDLRVTFMDVGQGTAVLIETRAHVSLYDTGPKAGERFSAARQIVLPSLAVRGWPRLDRLIVSHGDNDHAGGLGDMVAAIPVNQLLTYAGCQHDWQVDGVRFAVFQLQDKAASTNNRSCVLAIETAEHRILLTGDIEASAEYSLLEQFPGFVTLMSVPHHGSDSSSTPALLNKVRPAIAVATAGYQNRFGHPHEDIEQRYRRRHARFLNTGLAGAVEVEFVGANVTVRVARDEFAGPWRRMSF